MNADNVKLYAEIVIAAGTILGGVILCTKWFVDNQKRMKRLEGTLEKIHEIINRELRVNGGSSIKDAMNSLRIMMYKTDGRIRGMMDQSDMIGWESNTEGECVWVSPSMLRLLNRPAEDILGMAWKNMIPPRERERVEKEWFSAVHEGRNFYMDYTWVDSDGEEIPVRAQTKIVRGHKGKIVGYIAFADPEPTDYDTVSKVYSNSRR